VLTSYIVAGGIATPLTGWLTSRFGRKRVILACVAGFTTASMLVGSVQNLPQMVIFRVFQGMFGAPLGPLSQSVIYDINSRQRLGQAMAMWSLGVVAGPMVAPALGGWLTENYDWRWVFYINLPFGVLAYLGLLAYLPESNRIRGLPFDFVGFSLLAVAIGAFQVFLDRGQDRDWFNSSEIVIEAGLAFCALWMFCVYTATSDRPFFEPSILMNRTFSTGMLVAFVILALTFSVTALLPQFLQDLLNYPVLTAGELSLPRGIGSLVASLVVGRVMVRTPPNFTIGIIGVGLLLTALSLWQMTGYSLQIDETQIIVPGIIQGFGGVLVFVPLNTVIFSTLPAALRTEAMGLFAVVRSLGGSVGISLATSLLFRNTQINHAALATHVTVFNPSFRTSAVQQFWDLHTEAGLSAVNGEINRQAAMIAYVDDFKIMMILTLLSLPLLLLLAHRRNHFTSQPQPAVLVE
jgi:DHA2 family multidrug resistance protein